MDGNLIRINSIKNHPIASLDERFQLIYVRGLGACLNKLSQNSEITKMFFEAWANSILHFKTHEDFWRNDEEAIKRAISLKRSGLHFFSMKYSFFFDVFYLLEQSRINNSDNNYIVEYLEKSICGFFSKKALRKTNSYISEGFIGKGKIDTTLIRHREINEALISKTPKKILVVANVSAGKSTLINALIGHRLNKVKTTACTNKLVYIYNKMQHDGITYKTINKAYNYIDSIEDVNSDMFIEAALPFNSSLLNNCICFVDTPGVNNAEDLSHGKITEDAIKSDDYDAVMYISNSGYFETNDEQNILVFINKHVHKPILFVLNQLDKFVMEEDSISKMLGNYEQNLKSIGFRSPEIFPVSAHAAFLFRLNESSLSKHELRQMKDYQEQFTDPYYDLPTYIGDTKSSSLLKSSGILNIEVKLSKI